VWAVGNIGREKGGLKWPLLAAYASYPIRYYYYDKSVWITLMVLTSALVFDSYSKQWRRDPPKKRHVAKWSDVQQFVFDVYQFAQHHGWYEVWKQVVELCDPEDEQNAYKVLGVGPDASQQEITRRWRRLSRENHPDKAKLEDRRAAQEKFMEIQQAYEILSVGKHRRFSRNKKDNSVQDGPIHM
ncbi:jg9745, partial [Pararge aegeria aegeria]